MVPLYNEEATVDLLLSSVVSQTLPPTEIVIVDAGSTDRTSERVCEFESVLPIRLLTRGRLHPGEARNEGVRNASHEWLAFTDAGIRLDPGWLRSLMAAAVATRADVAFGSYEPVCCNVFDRCAAIAYVSSRRPDGVRGPVVVSMVVTRDLFDKAGGFPPWRAAEDLAFIERVSAAATRIAFAPSAIAFWQMPAGPAATFRRFADYSRHNLIAGRASTWHRGLARQYGVVFVVAGFLLLLGAGAIALLPLPLLLLARAARSAWTKRFSFPFATLHLGRMVGASCVLALLDAATWVGVARYLIERRRLARRGSP